MLRYGAYKLLRWQTRYHILDQALINKHHVYNDYIDLEYNETTNSLTVLWKYRNHRRLILGIEFNHSLIGCQVVYANDMFVYAMTQKYDSVEMTYFEWGKAEWVLKSVRVGFFFWDNISYSIEACQGIYPHWLSNSA